MAQLQYRHRLPVRVMHWINVVAFGVMLMSGLMIFNAHPTLYWGDQSYGGAPKLLQIRAVDGADGPIGLTTILGRTFDTTGVLGAAPNGDGRVTLHAFPHWATIPSSYSLAAGRRWHFFFMWILIANGLVYVLWSLASRHLSRDLAPTSTDLKSIWQSVKDHVRFRHPRGEAALRYNVLQKIAYLSVIFVWFPLVILMGFAMSPMLNALVPGWVDLFGGRQSARTLHFVAAFALLAFTLLHVFLVVTTGVWNNLRSMIDGRYRIRPALPALVPSADLPPIEFEPARPSPVDESSVDGPPDVVPPLRSAAPSPTPPTLSAAPSERTAAPRPDTSADASDAPPEAPHD